MLDYPSLKVIHILSSTLLFGTGLGTFFFMLMATRSGNVAAIKVTARTVVIADWLFTAPAVPIQLITGALLMNQLGFSFTSLWFISIMSLFIFVGCLWLPVVWIQIQMKNILRVLPDDAPLPSQFTAHMRRWTYMGYPAFGTVIVIFVLMIYKPGLH
ncbi:hypothetical protein A9Q99_18490 [Gammaproteobacteria bacterium 45_16_T64]|nr:hypothetical protein A9Q99_18490 [Gammaproteobacteria bacterium 45_16_T64]